MRHIKTFVRAGGPDSVQMEAKVYFHADWKEYFVRFWINGRMSARIYMTDDRDDAIATADWFVNGRQQ